MMMRIVGFVVLACALGLIAAAAMANYKPPLPEQNQNQAQDQDQLQGQKQDQAQDQAQGQNQTARSAIELTDDSDVDTVLDYKRNVPPMMGPSMSPSGPCMGVISGGGAGTSFGISLGKSVLDKGCEERETARLFAEMGHMLIAQAILCNGDAVERTIGKAACTDGTTDITAIGLPPTINFETSCGEACKQHERERRKCEAVGDCIPLPPTNYQK